MIFGGKTPYVRMMKMENCEERKEAVEDSDFGLPSSPTPSLMEENMVILGMFWGAIVNGGKQSDIGNV